MTPTWLPERRWSAQSDDRLAEMARNGHDDAFAAIVRRYHQPMLGLARRLCSDGRAEDVVQQTFLSALIAFRTGTEVNHLRAWLHQILRHTAARTAHAPEIELEAEFGNSAETVADAVQRRVATYQVLSALATLPTRQREAMIATALHGRSRSSVASSMGLSEGAVRQLMHRARRSLRSAAYVLIPWPVLRWISPGSAAAGDQAPEIAAAAWSTPTPVLATKLLTVVASSVLAIGTLGPHDRPMKRSPRTAPPAISSRDFAAQPVPDTARSTRIGRTPGDGAGRASTGSRGSSGPAAQSGGRHSSGDGSSSSGHGSSSSGHGSSSSGDGSSSSGSGGGFSSSGDGRSGSDGPSGGTPTTGGSSPPVATVAAPTDGGSGQPSGLDGSGSVSSDGGPSPTTDSSGGRSPSPTTDSSGGGGPSPTGDSASSSGSSGSGHGGRDLLPGGDSSEP